MGIAIFRVFVLGLLVAAGYFYPPFKLSGPYGALAAFLLGLAFIIIEIRIRRFQFKTIWSAGLGLIAGILLGWMIGRDALGEGEPRRRRRAHRDREPALLLQLGRGEHRETR